MHPVHARCSGAKLVQKTTISAGDQLIEYTSHSCSTQSVSRRGLFDSPPLCILFGTCKPPPPPAPMNVCGSICTNSCNDNAGDLPPTSQDCQTIANAIQIFQGTQNDTFTVAANHLETLTFGTCSLFFENLSSASIEYCFSSLSTEGIEAGDECFPPVQPFSSEGLCTGSKNLWAVGAAHS
ncbi:hypothetical protein JB92DRAFT_2810146 [Gautieria morchelliformis]|nr:hypothetical protein JB92DRAFT_2810146 [Gautieria morchelliformis]